MQITLAAMLLGAAVSASAGVPVITLAQPSGEFARTVVVTAASSDQAVTLLAPTAPEQPGQTAGSFASLASGAYSALATAAAVMPATAGSRYGLLVAARPQPSLGAILLLLLGSLIYLGRPRQQGFALRPSKTLLERDHHAPAHG
ncbi:hypothetical protein [Actimicrobium sp. GrIS 1.19]|uniref:hypothetical protein n=1 Tax=Actimicrobium sp. GrIS 1.19 TaxID=3071708 RepID=UPI002E0F53B9